MKLSRAERLVLSNQYRILEALYPAERPALAAAREAVERGFELHYGRIAEHVADDEGTLGAEQCREVLDILQMFAVLRPGYHALDDKSGIEERRTRFRGFDVNDPVESACAAYARFTCRLDAARFKDVDRGNDFTSQLPLLGTYRKMLRAWHASADESALGRDDIVRITTF